MSEWTESVKSFDDASLATGAGGNGAVIDLEGVFGHHAMQAVVDEGDGGETQVWIYGSLDGENFYLLAASGTGADVSGVQTVFTSGDGAARYIRAQAFQLTEWGGCTGLTTWHTSEK